MADLGREPVGDESLENWKELGSGGFGYVYKANHKDWQFEVAIKLHAGSGTLSTALGREADYMDAVSHQFVPRVYGMYRGIPPDPKLGSIERQGIVMELMEGGSLQTLQQALSGPPPWPLAFRLAHQVALAMNFLHSKKSPVVHSDLKPGNVLLDASLGAKIADFGLSTVSTSVQNITNKGDEGGTLAYTPPEAFEQGQDYRLVRSYDIYSYGILLWTILTGKEPYLAGVKHDVLTFRIIKGDRPDLDKIDQSKAEGLEELVDLMKKCWDKDPTKRPTFRGCTEVTGRVFSKHEKGIHAAVTETLTKLDLVNRHECVRPQDQEGAISEEKGCRTKKYTGEGLICAFSGTVLLVVGTATNYWMQFKDHSGVHHYQGLWNEIVCTDTACFTKDLLNGPPPGLPTPIRAMGIVLFLLVMLCVFGILIGMKFYAQTLKPLYAGGLFLFSSVTVALLMVIYYSEAVKVLDRSMDGSFSWSYVLCGIASFMFLFAGTLPFVTTE